MIETLLGPLSSSLSAELNGQQWPVMPPLFTWIYQHVNPHSIGLIIEQIHFFSL